MKLTADLVKLRRETSKARRFPMNTCPASRHVQIMADVLARGGTYHPFNDEPQHCAESLYAVLAALWAARTLLAKERV